MKNPVTALLRFLILLYQKLLSPLKPPTCRFHPTCSTYFREALRKKGLLRGTLAGVRRILRCHPFAEGGYDPVEAEEEEAQEEEEGRSLGSLDWRMGNRQPGMEEKRGRENEE